MRILQFFTICFVICGYIKPIYSDGLPANPWGKDTAANTAETAADAAPLKANPWKNPDASHLVNFSDSADSDTAFASSKPASAAITINSRPTGGTMSHTKSPIKIISRSEANGGYNTFVNPNDDDFSSLWSGLLPSGGNAAPTFSGGNNSADFDILPDFGKLKRDSMRKFNNATAPVRKIGTDAKEYFEKGSGIKLNNLF